MPNSIGLTAGQPFNPYRLFTGIFIPQALASNPNISPGAKLVYGRLARYAGDDGKCHPAVKTLAAEVGLEARQTQRYLKELKNAGFIEVAVRFKAPGVHDTNGYIFVWHESLAESVRNGVVTPPLVSDVTPPVASEKTPPLVSDVTPKESPLKESHMEESVPTSSAGQSADASFPEEDEEVYCGFTKREIDSINREIADSPLVSWAYEMAERDEAFAYQFDVQKCAWLNDDYQLLDDAVRDIVLDVPEGWSPLWDTAPGYGAVYSLCGDSSTLAA